MKKQKTCLQRDFILPHIRKKNNNNKVENNHNPNKQIQIILASFFLKEHVFFPTLGKKILKSLN